MKEATLCQGHIDHIFLETKKHLKYWFLIDETTDVEWHFIANIITVILMVDELGTIFFIEFGRIRKIKLSDTWYNTWEPIFIGLKIKIKQLKLLLL